MSGPPDKSPDRTAPPEVVGLAELRTQARAARDFGQADRLRDEVHSLGWELTDTPDGYVLTVLPAYPVAASLTDLPDLSADPPTRACSAGLLVEGWPQDVRRCVEALLAHGPADLVIVGLDIGNVDGAGDVLHELAVAHPGRVEAWHLGNGPDQVGWGPARTALLRLDPARVHLVLDPSTVLTGDAITPLLDDLARLPDAVAVGWRGAQFDVADGWRSVVDTGPGEVDVLLSYLFAVDRAAGLAAPPHPKARFYRNADLEWSLALRETGGRLYVVEGELPCHQERHRGYHDSDPAYRDKESRRTYDRLLARFRGRTDLLSPRRDRVVDPAPAPAPSGPAPVRLAELTTLRLGGPARAVLAPLTEAQLVATVLDLDRSGRPLLLVGGGSNLVVADDGFDGTVVRLLNRGVSEAVGTSGSAGCVLPTVEVTAAAGEPWDELVLRTVEAGLAGLEALSGIPGLVGATPIQNVGAYGQEVAQTVVRLRALDRDAGEVRTLSAAECGFGYRSSAFRGDDRLVVLEVTFGLRRSDESSPVRYAELAASLGLPVGTTAPLADVRAAVLRLRRAKGMVVDPLDPDSVSAGSFFTNPVLSPEAAAALPELAPRYPAADGRTKTSAAWLIEQAGFAKGYGTGRVRISTKHSLALTTAEGATTSDLLALAREIRSGVLARFGIELTAEPVLVGCSL